MLAIPDLNLSSESIWALLSGVITVSILEPYFGAKYFRSLFFIVLLGLIVYYSLN